MHSRHSTQALCLTGLSDVAIEGGFHTLSAAEYNPKMYGCLSATASLVSCAIPIRSAQGHVLTPERRQKRLT